MNSSFSKENMAQIRFLSIIAPKNGAVAVGYSNSHRHYHACASSRAGQTGKQLGEQCIGIYIPAPCQWEPPAVSIGTRAKIDEASATRLAISNSS